jgi:hypothetical protein
MTDQTDWDRVYRSNHYSRLTSMRVWSESAIELVAAAEALAPLVMAYWDSVEAWQADRALRFEDRRKLNEHSYHNAFLMLYAFAIENYCKGSLAQRLNDEERERLRLEGTFPKRLLHTHNILGLAKAAGHPVASIEEEALLRRLTHAAEWAGRYPVSKDFRENFAEKFSNGETYSLSFIARSDVERVRVLAATIREEVGGRITYRVQRKEDWPERKP